MTTETGKPRFTRLIAGPGETEDAHALSVAELAAGRVSDFAKVSGVRGVVRSQPAWQGGDVRRAMVAVETPAGTAEYFVQYQTEPNPHTIEANAEILVDDIKQASRRTVAHKG